MRCQTHGAQYKEPPDPAAVSRGAAKGDVLSREPCLDAQGGGQVAATPERVCDALQLQAVEAAVVQQRQRHARARLILSAQQHTAGFSTDTSQSLALLSLAGTCLAYQDARSHLSKYG